MFSDKQVMFPLAFDLAAKFLPEKMQSSYGKEFFYSAEDVQQIKKILFDPKYSKIKSKKPKAIKTRALGINLTHRIVADAIKFPCMIEIEVKSGESYQVGMLGILLKYGTEEIKDILTEKMEAEHILTNARRAQSPRKLGGFTSKDFLNIIIATHLNITFKKNTRKLIPLQGGPISFFDYSISQVFEQSYNFDIEQVRKIYKVKKDENRRLHIVVTTVCSLSAGEKKLVGILKFKQPYVIESLQEGGIKIAYNEAAASYAMHDPENFPISVPTAFWEAGVNKAIDKIFEIQQKNNLDKKAEFNKILPFTPFLQHSAFMEEFLKWRSTLNKANRKTVDSDIEKYFKPFPTILRNYNRQKRLLPLKLIPRWAKWGIATAIILSIIAVIIWMPWAAPFVLLKFGNMIASGLGFSASNSILTAIAASTITFGGALVAAIAGKVSSMVEARSLVKTKEKAKIETKIGNKFAARKSKAAAVSQLFPIPEEQKDLLSPSSSGSVSPTGSSLGHFSIFNHDASSENSQSKQPQDEKPKLTNTREKGDYHP